MSQVTNKQLNPPIKVAGWFALGANLVPLVGVLWFSWDAVFVIALYWIENLIIGVFNLLKMLIVVARDRIWSGLVKCVFFVFHYGLFCVAHGILLNELIGNPDLDYTSFFEPHSGPLRLFFRGAAVLLYFIQQLQPAIWLAISAIGLSRLVGLIESFFLEREWRQARLGKLMAEPYKQIIVLHIGLIVGAVMLQKLGSPVWLLALIVLLKIGFELRALRRQSPSNKVSAELDPENMP